MPHKLSAEQQLELETLYRSASVIAGFFDALTPSLPAGGFGAALLRALEQRDLRGMRMAHNDLVAATQAATSVQKRELDEALRDQAGVSLVSLVGRQYQRVERIRARGRVTSEEQYYLVREYIEFAALDPERAAEVPQLAAMLKDFEQRAVAAAQKRLRQARSSEE